MAVTSKYLAAGASDPGRLRENNEDRFHVDAERGIFLVVDGMGGQAAGEMAAEIAVSMIRARLERQTGAAAERIREAIAIANNEVHRLSHSNAAWAGMACVLTVALVEDGRATVGHVGDSRLYLLTPAGIRKVTRDHSPIGEIEERNELTERQAMRHPRRNEVFRDVGSAEHGPDDEDFIDVTQIEFPADSALLLCSDGLSDLLTSEEISRIADRHAGNPRAAAEALINAANAAGGKDNVTVIVVEGREYGSPTRTKARDQAAAAAAMAERPSNPLAGRWAFLVYGALLGMLLLSALQPLLNRDAEPLTDSGITAPQTWPVEPGGIDDALAKAKPGDTVLVAPGEYTGPVQLRDGVHLVSRQLQGAVLRPNAQGIAVLGEGLKSGRFAGFKIAGHAARPLTVGLDLKDSEIEVTDVSISGASLAGVDIRGNSTAILRANQISGNGGTGVIIRDTAAPRLAHNVISGNGKGDRIRKPGVDIRDAARPTLLGNTISGNAAEPIWATPATDGSAIVTQNFFGPLSPAAGRRAVRVIQR